MSEMEGEKKDKFDTKSRNTVISFYKNLENEVSLRFE